MTVATGHYDLAVSVRVSHGEMPSAGVVEIACRKHAYSSDASWEQPNPSPDDTR